MPTINTEPVVRQGLVDVLTGLGLPMVVNSRQRSNLATYIYSNDRVQAVALASGDVSGAKVEIRKMMDLGGSIDVRRMWTLNFWWEYDDAGDSETTFRGHLWTVQDAFTRTRSIQGGSLTDYMPDLVTFRYARREKRLVHFAQIEQETMSEEIVVFDT